LFVCAKASSQLFAVKELVENREQLFGLFRGDETPVAPVAVFPGRRATAPILSPKHAALHPPAPIGTRRKKIPTVSLLSLPSYAALIVHCGGHDLISEPPRNYAIDISRPCWDHHQRLPRAPLEAGAIKRLLEQSDAMLRQAGCIAI
jgi:hypothetical protein